MADKGTIMVLKVDLQCCRCYEKIKKILCKFRREIQGQVYDEKQNTVTITVICCNPDKFRAKLCCKGGKTIKSIEIKEKEPPKPPTEKKEPPKPKPEPLVICCWSCYHGGPCYHGCGRPISYPCYDGYWYGANRGCHVSRCDYLCEENPVGCTIV